MLLSITKSRDLRQLSGHVLQGQGGHLLRGDVDVAVILKAVIVLLLFPSYNNGGGVAKSTVARHSSVTIVRASKIAALVSSSKIAHCQIGARR